MEENYTLKHTVTKKDFRIIIVVKAKVLKMFYLLRSSCSSD